jgi:chromate transport protein ChrA
VDRLTLALAVLAAIALFHLRFNSFWLILAGGLAGCFRMLM